jgi:outer membrane immunogenic protein
VGCNWQSGSFVLGIETDIDYLGASKTTNRTGVAATAPLLGSVTQKLGWLGTVRGRVGVTPATDWLIYATGGLAYGRTHYSHLFVNTSGTPNEGFAGSASDIPVGWTIGAGAEFMMTSNWTVKGEYLYYDLGSTRVVGLPFNQRANGFGADGNYQTKGNLVRVGLNYKF